MDGQEGHEYTASLRVSSEQLRFSELEARLGTPTNGFDIGDPVSRKRPDGSKRRHAQWSLQSSMARERPLDEHIDELVAFAEAHGDALNALRPDCRIDLFCGLFTGTYAQGGFTIEPSLSQRLSDVQLAVVVDVY